MKKLDTHSNACTKCLADARSPTGTYLLKEFPILARYIFTVIMNEAGAFNSYFSLRRGSSLEMHSACVKGKAILSIRERPYPGPCLYGGSCSFPSALSQICSRSYQPNRSSEKTVHFDRGSCRHIAQRVFTVWGGQHQVHQGERSGVAEFHRLFSLQARIVAGDTLCVLKENYFGALVYRDRLEASH